MLKSFNINSQKKYGEVAEDGIPPQRVQYPCREEAERWGKNSTVPVMLVATTTTWLCK
jgi:hypothetical protein